MSSVAVTHLMEFSQPPGRAPFGGAEHHLFALLEGQAAAGMDVELVMLVGWPGPELVARAARLREAGVSVVMLEPRAHEPRWRRRAARAAHVPGLFRLLRARRDRIVHVHLEIASQLGRATAAAAGCRVVVETFHTDDPRYASPSWRLRLRLLDRVTSQSIAISEQVRRHLVERVGLDPDRVCVVHYGVAPPAPGAVPAALRSSIGVDDGFVAGFVGRLVPEKQVDVLLRALGALPDVTGVIVGDGPELGRLEALSGDLGLSRVRFLGHRSDAPELIAAFDVLCLPSRWEGLGLVLLEAMVRGVPVIGSRAGAIPEILGDGRYGVLVPSGDASALAAAIAAVRDDVAEARSGAEQARAHALAEHSIERMVERTSAAYARALSAR